MDVFGRLAVSLWLMMAILPGVAMAKGAADAAPAAATAASVSSAPAPVLPEASPAIEADVGMPSIFQRSLSGGPVVFSCLLLLIGLSVLCWAIVIAKWFHIVRVQRTGEAFVKGFWDSRSLNDLNGRLADYPYSPAREVFRTGYAELVRASQLREQAAAQELAVHAAVDNLNRALGKAKLFERRRMERFMPVLAITASVSPFIGLFGTVWGIMGAFEGIARTGSASLAAVAPGISEALIATAFGLAAAIPAVVGYNIFAAKVRSMSIHLDGFIADFLNIVERYLVTDRGGRDKGATAGSSGLGERL